MIRVACVGLGAIGLDIARTIVERDEFQIVAAVDTALDIAGRSFHQLLGRGATSMSISPRLADALVESVPDVVILATSSRLSSIIPQVTTCLDGGAAVVTTCEELSYPWRRSGTNELHRRAVAAGRAVLSVGVNPGYVMDLVPALLSLPCSRIDAVEVERAVDLTRRRPALRAKAGVGLSVREFDRLARSEAIGHVGLDCSAMLLAAALGVPVDGWPEVVMDPLVDRNRTVVGFRQRTSIAPINGAARLELKLEMSTLLQTAEGDHIRIHGVPDVDAQFEGGISGDAATAGLVVNAIPLVLGAAPGVHTVLDLPPLRGWKPPLQ
jgi:4-hydroxy-tetrahydrodipicolinate reductase